ncbi:hypothetical protein LNP74_25395 [Klebsiella pneumoniae subsp. pneumoniae]|nr:hypothetical protein [Klebsiella pneumoniae subsp. pneumoniae]
MIAPATPGELPSRCRKATGNRRRSRSWPVSSRCRWKPRANSRAQIEAPVPAGYKPVFMNPLVSLYAARDMKPMMGKPRGGAGVPAAAGGDRHRRFQPQFTTWVSLLTDPAVSGMARDVVLSDAMMGYLALYQRHPHPGDPLVI